MTLALNDIRYHLHGSTLYVVSEQFTGSISNGMVILHEKGTSYYQGDKEVYEKYDQPGRVNAEAFVRDVLIRIINLLQINLYEPDTTIDNPNLLPTH